jgi:hypothetical protein
MASRLTELRNYTEILRAKRSVNSNLSPVAVVVRKQFIQ